MNRAAFHPAGRKELCKIKDFSRQKEGGKGSCTRKILKIRIKKKRQGGGCGLLTCTVTKRKWISLENLLKNYRASKIFRNIKWGLRKNAHTTFNS